ncbi:MAG: glucose-1-phosphate thymidylyltransferase [Thermoplasmata archaeon]
MKGVILHGGAGTRLRPLTHTGPKQLIKIANKPMSQYAIEALVEAGITEIAIILGEIFAEKVIETYGDGSKLGCKITYIHQGKPLGIAHAVGLTKDFVGNDKFLVYLGDNLIGAGIQEFTKKFEQGSMDAMIIFTPHKNPQKFGVARFSKEGKLVELLEKPKDPPSNYVITGIYYLTPVAFDYISKLKPSWRGELEITDMLQNMLSDGLNVGYEFINGWWKDTGTAEDILAANQLVLDKIEMKLPTHIKCETQGRVQIAETAKISDDVTIRGPAIIGENTVIENGTYIGPYTSVGNNVILRSCEIENSIILDNTVIDAHTKIIDSIIGTGTEITQIKRKPMAHRMVVGENTKIALGE